MLDPTPSRYAPPQGRRPSLDWLSPGELAIDHSYQRAVDSGGSQKLIRRIAEEWRWDLCLPLLVSRRPDGQHFVVDGQHRLAAAVMRGDILVLPCFVRDLADAAAEAALFITANRSRRPMTPLADHHAAVAAGDEEACTIARLVEAAGLAIARSPGSSNQPIFAGELTGVTGLRTALRQHGEAVVGPALKVVGEAFPDEVLVNAAAITGGVILLLAHLPGIDTDRLFEVLLERTSAEWSDLAGLDDVQGGNRRAQVLRDVFRSAYFAADRLEAA